MFRDKLVREFAVW